MGKNGFMWMETWRGVDPIDKFRQIVEGVDALASPR